MIVCVKCNRQMRPKKNGVEVVEEAKLHGKQEDFSPYRLFAGDLWECQDCGAEVIYVAPTQGALQEHFMPRFQERIAGVEYRAKDWSR